MSVAREALESLVSITQFNKGQASRIFDRLSTEKKLIVLKNNKPSAVILSPEEYIRLSEMAEDFLLLEEAANRLEANKEKKTIPFERVVAELGLTAEDLENAEDVKIE